MQGNLYSPQNTRMSFVCTLMACGTNQRKESILQAQHILFVSRDKCAIPVLLEGEKQGL